VIGEKKILAPTARRVAVMLALIRAPFVWPSTNPIANPEFRTKLSASPSSAVASPHLFEKIAVPGLCGAQLTQGEVVAEPCALVHELFA
jgi:hypothetical protein